MLGLFNRFDSVPNRRNTPNWDRAAKSALCQESVLRLYESHGRTWLEGLFYIRRPFDLSAFESALPQDLRGRRTSDVIESVLKPLRVKVAHALFGSAGELPVSSDDLTHTCSIASRLLVTKCLVRRMLNNDFLKGFLSHLPG